MIMKTLTRVKSYLTRPNKAISPSEIPRMTTLAGLPPELLLSISDFLPVVDLVCFSLCNRRFFALSQRQIKRLPPRTQDDTLSILNRLERDTPEYFSCDMCNILHRYDGSESFGLSVSEREKTCRLPCVQTRRWFSTSCTMRTHLGITYAQYEFSFLHLKLAMKRFHYGPRSGLALILYPTHKFATTPCSLSTQSYSRYSQRRHRYVLTPSVFISECRT